MTAQTQAAPSVKASSAPSETRAVSVQLRNIHKRFGDQVALEQINLDVYEGEFVALLGPSGCGKTTLLRLIAGFDTPDEGEVMIGGQAMAGVEAFRRPVNTVFQSYALFPHLSVRDNVMFGLKMRGVDKKEARERVEKTLQTVAISQLAERRPAQLSGGQQQRVALARAVVNEPQVLLLDEPLGALDLKLRKQLQIELMQLQQRLGITFVYVTHDQEEALVMSDRIAVMNTGLIEQIGSAEDVYERPKTRYVATFLGTSNLIEGVVSRVENGTAILDTEHGPIRSRVGRYRADQSVTVAFRPEKVRVLEPPHTPNDDDNVLYGDVEEVVYSGMANQYLIRSGDQTLHAYVANQSLVSHDRFSVGSPVALVIPAQSVVKLDD
ncbi:MAG: ABC transporter ATP-binding protein [Trueperaceae bacterium]|nr:ABC transporter ATP-binding protein [Trueperaceae bacterium]